MCHGLGGKVLHPSKALPMTQGDLMANGFQTAHLGYEEAGLACAAMIMSGYLGRWLCIDAVQPLMIGGRQCGHGASLCIISLNPPTPVAE
jgi:hypothetical protein